jgi:hypothetical protein
MFSLDIKRGSLDETPDGRRTLMRHYKAKGPQYVREMMTEQYEIYTRVHDESVGRFSGLVIKFILV